MATALRPGQQQLIKPILPLLAALAERAGRPEAERRRLLERIDLVHEQHHPDTWATLSRGIYLTQAHADLVALWRAVDSPDATALGQLASPLQLALILSLDDTVQSRDVVVERLLGAIHAVERAFSVRWAYIYCFGQMLNKIRRWTELNVSQLFIVLFEFSGLLQFGTKLDRPVFCLVFEMGGPAAAVPTPYCVRREPVRAHMINVNESRVWSATNGLPDRLRLTLATAGWLPPSVLQQTCSEVLYCAPPFVDEEVAEAEEAGGAGSESSNEDKPEQAHEALARMAGIRR